MHVKIQIQNDTEFTQIVVRNQNDSVSILTILTECDGQYLGSKLCNRFTSSILLRGTIIKVDL